MGNIEDFVNKFPLLLLLFPNKEFDFILLSFPKSEFGLVEPVEEIFPKIFPLLFIIFILFVNIEPVLLLLLVNILPELLLFGPPKIVLFESGLLFNPNKGLLLFIINCS